jgi:hypothetical protein
MSKDIDGDSNCVYCHRYTEYNWHLFLDCADSIEFWKKMNVWVFLEQLMINAEGFHDVFIRLYVSQLVTFAMTAWSIWRKRNLQPWEDKKETMQQVIGRVRSAFQAWQHKQMQQTEDNNRFNMFRGSLHQQVLLNATLMRRFSTLNKRLVWVLVSGTRKDIFLHL